MFTTMKETLRLGDFMKDTNIITKNGMWTSNEHDV